ncbi:hypothetical protein HHUSO_G12219 [Huso huso]|uniref:THD domain-containing protein n=1 Tax=Huso huso TaxID=61971 RepID=A0ABR0ZI32_HUSHU
MEGKVFLESSGQPPRVRRCLLGISALALALLASSISAGFCFLVFKNELGKDPPTTAPPSAQLPREKLRTSFKVKDGDVSNNNLFQFIVPEDSWYFVYIQVTGQEGQEATTAFSVKLYRNNTVLNERDLPEIKNCKCQPSVTLSGMYNLTRGDTLSVKLNGEHKVLKDLTVFGIFEL